MSPAAGGDTPTGRPSLPESAQLPTPRSRELTRGARWQVEGLAIPMALRAMGNVLGVDLGREVRGNWSTDHAYVLCAAACGDLFRFALRIPSAGAAPTETRDPEAAALADALGRGFRALGYRCRVLRRAGGRSGDGLKRRVAEALATQGRPSLVVGVPRPGHVTLVTGYEQGGDVLCGWSCGGGGPSILFEPDQPQQRFPDWIGAAEIVALCGERLPEGDDRLVYRHALEQGLALLRLGSAAGWLEGQPLLEAWAETFQRAESPDEVERAAAMVDPYVWDLAERRHYGRVFLQKASETLPSAAADLLDAAGAFGAIHDLMWAVFRAAGGQWPGDPTPGTADPEARREMARLIRSAAVYDREAAGLLESALRRLPAEGPSPA